jgi:hypothetical protein
MTAHHPTEPASQLAYLDNLPTDYGVVALALVDNGWAPAPLKPETKKAWRKAWNHRTGMTRNELRSEVRRELGWRGNADCRHHSCGIVAPSSTLAVDIDLLDPASNDRAWDIMVKTFGIPAMVRIGRAPKSLSVYPVFGGTGIVSQKLGGIELFCGSGQFAAYGVHPMTGQPYRWTPKHPLNTHIVDMGDLGQTLTARQVFKFVDELRRAEVLTQVAHGVGNGTWATYPATMRLRELIAKHGGYVVLGVEALIDEVGNAEKIEHGDHERHNALVGICGYLVRKGWSDRQALDLLVQAVNEKFGEGDWTEEIERALAHARDREIARTDTLRARLGPRPDFTEPQR